MEQYLSQKSMNFNKQAESFSDFIPEHSYKTVEEESYHLEEQSHGEQIMDAIIGSID